MGVRGDTQRSPPEYDDPEQRGVPNNLWPGDRSWFVHSDYDLCGTTLSGPERLVASIKADPVLETVELPEERRAWKPSSPEDVR